MYIHASSLPLDSHNRHIFGGSKLILAQKAVLDVKKCVLVYCICWPFSLQFEHHHATVMAWGVFMCIDYQEHNIDSECRSPCSVQYSIYIDLIYCLHIYSV